MTPHDLQLDSTATGPDAFRAFEVGGWNRRATVAGYQQFFEAITTCAIAPVLDAARVRAGISVLDAGAGPGSLAAASAARGAGTVGVDFSEEMVILARSLHPSIEFRCADVERLPFPDRSFDAVVANFLVPHLSRPERCVIEFARVLKPGGYLALSTWDGRAAARLFGIFYDAMEQAGARPPADLPPGPSFFRFADDTEFSRLLQSGGLERVEVRRTSFTHVCSSPEDLWSGVLSGGVRAPAMILGQTPEMQQRIRAGFDRLVEPYLTADGSLLMPVSVKIASGVRTAG